MSSNSVILIIDDDRALRRAISLMLEGERFSILEAGNAREALDILQGGTVDVAIVNLFLPDRDGMELSAHIRTMFPEVNVVLITADTEHPLAVEARRMYKDRYLEKYSLGVSLRDRVRELVRGSDSK